MPEGARDDLAILAELSRRLGHDLGDPTAEELWDELRQVSPMHAGMSYARLAELGGIQWPCPDESHPGSPFLHGRLWAEPLVGPRTPFHAVEQVPPVDVLDADFPLRLTTGRRLESFNTGVQTQSYPSPLRRGETVDLAPADAARLGIEDGERVRVTSRRGTVTAPARIDSKLRPGLVFMTFHFPDEVDTNTLTIDATDPKSGTAEFKGAGVRVEKLRGGAENGTLAGTASARAAADQ
jgi:formate dehydrogenase major subunit